MFKSLSVNILLISGIRRCICTNSIIIDEIALVSGS